VSGHGEFDRLDESALTGAGSRWTCFFAGCPSGR